MNLKNFIQGSVFDKIFQISILVIALAALVVRILWFVDIPDLFGDEVSLAENLFNKSFFGYFGKLDIDQAAPPLFLVFTRFFTYFISDFEYSLRVIPFLSSIFSIFAFLALLFKVFKRKSAIIIAFSMFCFLPKILFYSYAFKQYSSDILIFILIMLSYFYLDFNKKDWKFYFLIVLYGVSIWFSYPEYLHFQEFSL